MRRILIVILASACALAGAGDTRADTETKPRVRQFLGSFQVAAERREEASKFLKEKGFPGAFVPEDAAPTTLLYRGPKTEYEQALDALNRHLHPEWYLPKKKRSPTPKEIER